MRISPFFQPTRISHGIRKESPGWQQVHGKRVEEAKPGKNPKNMGRKRGPTRGEGPNFLVNFSTLAKLTEVP